MRLQTKASLFIFLIGSLALLLSSTAYQYLARQAALDEKEHDLMIIAIELASHVQSLLESKIQLTQALGTNPVLKDALRQSNSEYTPLSEEQRAAKIKQLDRRWRSESSSDSPFIQSYMSNPAAMQLKAQQQVLPDVYGEIFMTNRFGAMIATTGHLSTLAHAHKYWWQGSYAEGKGITFLDDRGFDTSVQDVVLGIVVPIKEQGEIIGILKCNILIAGPISQLVNAFNQRSDKNLQLARTGGLVVSGAGQPLSQRLPTVISDLLTPKRAITALLDTPYEQLIATLPIDLTLGGVRVSFGGDFESVDHIKGNTGEAWHLVVSIDKALAMKPADEASWAIFMTGTGFIILGILLAILLGPQLAKPIRILADGARRIGDGALHTRIHLNSHDEISELAESLNQMAEKLSTTMASRDELSHEIEQRMEAEKRLVELATTDELTGAYNRHYFTTRLQEEMARAKRYDEPVSLIMFDVDNFKNINDTHGHSVGDVVLKRLVTLAKTTLRHQDTLTRWGGEEFLIILPHTDLNAASQLAERLRSKVAELDFTLPHPLTISLGVTEIEHNDSCDTIIKRVDKTLYEAKSCGRNCVMPPPDALTSPPINRAI